MTYGKKAVVARREIIFVAIGIALAAAGLTVAVTRAAEPVYIGHPTDFTSVEYYPVPNQGRMKSRLYGAEAQPMAGGLLVVKELKLETFSTNGQPQMVVNAPECIYDSFNGTANSPGKLRLQNGDGKIRVEGEGFLWQQADSFLTISNEVRTTIETDAKGQLTP